MNVRIKKDQIQSVSGTMVVMEYGWMEVLLHLSKKCFLFVW